MSDIKEVRRQQLRKLVSEHEGMTNLARKLGLMKGAYISQLLTNPPTRDLSEKTARKWEKALRLPERWLDGAQQSSPLAANSDLLAQVVTEVLEALEGASAKLAPAQIGDLVAIQYADALAAGRVDPGRIRKIVALFSKR